MKYDFLTLKPAFGTGAPMWERLRAFGEPERDAVEFGVAEMKFKIAPEIASALKNQIKNGGFGYSGPSDALMEEIPSWMSRRHNWKVDKDWIRQTYGLVAAIGYCVQALTKPEDAVLVNFPSYAPFFNSVNNNNRKLVRSDLILEDGRYVMDLEDMERKIVSENVKLFIFCNPHNPTGRVWTAEELNALGDICLRHNVLVVSDEIHFDLTYPGHEHSVFASLSAELSDITVTLTAPSKSFNIAGMTISNVIISNPELRERVGRIIDQDMGHYINAFGFVACEAAYRDGETWLNDCIKVLNHNCSWLRSFLSERVPIFSCNEQEGTYLVWMDCSGAGLEPEELDNFLWQEAKFYSQRGSVFGQGYELFHRVNLACPFEYVEKAALRLEAAAKARGLI